MIISACGNDCSTCPRFMPKTDNELKSTAVLWNKIGYRDKIISNQEIACYGCKPENYCRYKIIDCTEKHNIQNCGECGEYPCNRIIEAFSKTMLFEPKCKEVCTDEEYEVMEKAFFHKQNNLDRVRNKLTR